MPVLNTTKKKNYYFVLKERNALLWLVLLIFFVVLVVFLDSLKPIRTSAPDLVEEILDNKMQGTDVPSISEINQPDPPSRWQSFGDSFSSSVYLDKAQTDLFLDDMTTSLVFPPLNSWRKIEDCVETGCDLTSSSRVGNFLFESEEINYLADLRKMPQPLPSKVRNKKIVAASLSNLGSSQIASFVISEGEEERGFVYYLENNKYIPIIDDETDEQIITKYGRGNGFITANGEDNNFLIIYLGYEIHAFHFFDNELNDISHFFGLRVADDGFYPYIIKQGIGRESVWYVLSLEKNRQRLIKLWQNDTNYIKGSLDLSAQLNANLRATGGQAVYFRSGLVKGELEFIVENPDESQSLWLFKDEGFDNSKNRQAVSINLNKKNLKTIKAHVRSFGLSTNHEDRDDYVDNFLSEKVKIYLGDSLDNFQLVDLGEMIKFNDEKNELYWKAEFEKSNKNDYSPWFDHINDLQYLVYL